MSAILTEYREVVQSTLYYLKQFKLLHNLNKSDNGGIIKATKQLGALWLLQFRLSSGCVCCMSH